MFHRRKATRNHTNHEQLERNPDLGFNETFLNEYRWDSADDKEDIVSCCSAVCIVFGECEIGCAGWESARA